MTVATPRAPTTTATAPANHTGSVALDAVEHAAEEACQIERGDGADDDA